MPANKSLAHALMASLLPQSGHQPMPPHSHASRECLLEAKHREDTRYFRGANAETPPALHCEPTAKFHVACGSAKVRRTGLCPSFRRPEWRYALFRVLFLAER